MGVLLSSHRPRAIVHFAAESHVDRSILGPADFMRTMSRNIRALFRKRMLITRCFRVLSPSNFSFLHVSTDEVYGCSRSRRPAVLGGHSICAEQPIFGEQGG